MTENAPPEHGSADVPGPPGTGGPADADRPSAASDPADQQQAVGAEVESRSPESSGQPDKPASELKVSPPSNKPSAPGGDEHEGRIERSYLDRVDDEERDWRRRQQNLRDLDGEDSAIRAGGNYIGRNYFRADDGSKIFTAAGDMKIDFGADGVGAAPVLDLPPGEVEQLRKCLVATPSQAKLTDALGREQLVFLRGAETTGRRTAALHALLTWVGDGATDAEGKPSLGVGVIPMTGLLSRQTVPELRPRHGYFLDATTTERIGDLQTLADILKDRAAKRDCRVVILVSVDREDLPARVIDHQPPSAHQVFHSWLAYEAECAGIDVDLPDDMLQEINDNLNQESLPRDAIKMARWLVSRLSDGWTADALRAELSRQSEESIRRRLDENRPVLGRCFMISSAVLNGLQEVTVSNAALALAEHIKKVRSIKPEEPLPAWEQLHAWLEYANAKTSPAQIAGGGRTVHLNSGAAILTLQVLWEDHPTIREPVIDWLKGLAEETPGRQEVQMKAAHAAGVLASFDFDTTRSRFLDPWVSSRDLRDHRLAAMMLESAVREPDILQRVLDLLKGWSGGRREERLVAVHAYGSRIGLSAFSNALRDLRRISFRCDAELARSVAGSIGNLYSMDTANAILRELSTWLDSGTPSSLYTSALAFMRLARIGRGNPSRPPLIELNPGRDLVDLLSMLWQNALSLRITTYRPKRSNLAAPDSWRVLLGWINKYEEERTVRQVIDGIIKVGGSERAWLRRAFILNLRRWERRRLISQDLCHRLMKLAKGG